MTKKDVSQMTTRHSTHTPGPWTTEEAPHRAFIGQIGNGQVRIWTERQAQPGESYEWGSAQADARLIAAAPDLYMALQDLLAAVDSPASDNEPWQHINARKALEKARG